jgi:neurotransmitter:Na+ symporter, NSS family
VAERPAREQWASRIGVILAVAGSAVGLGNFLRFPGLAAQNGGGAFMLPYFVSLVILGIPLCWAEWTMGRYAGIRGFNSAPGIFTVIWRNPAAKYFGVFALIIPLVIYMYYVLIEAWCLGYAISYLTGEMAEEGRDFSAHFAQFVGMEEDGALLTPGNRRWLLVLAGVFLLNFTMIYRGVSKGIELLCKFAMPVMVLLAFIVLARVMTLGTPDPSLPDQSVIGGLGFMWNPHPEKLRDPRTWLAASGQIFFSLSVGFGVIINYASYLKENDDVALSGLTSSSVNEFFEVCLGGLITVPAAFIFFGLAAEQFTGSSFGLGFNALPNVFARMWGGQFFGFLWFFMLFLAAVTSSVSMLQPVIAFFEEGFGLKRHASATLLGLITALGCGYVVYFSKGLTALDTFDFWVGSVLIIALAFFQAILYGWVFGIRRGDAELHRGAHIRVPFVVQLMLKFLVPVYLLVIFGAFCWINVPSHAEKLFPIPTASSAVLDQGAVPPELRQRLAEAEETLPENYRVEPHPPQKWVIREESGPTRFVIRRMEGELEVFAWKLGYAETIWYNRVALGSVLFIGVVFAFLLAMIHIAGRRWEAEGTIR